MTLPSFTDLGLAAVVLVLAIVPAALAVLAIIGVLQATRLDTALEAGLGAAGYRTAGLLGALALVALFLRFSWDWAAATHLKPLCAALARPWYGDAAPAGPANLRVRRRILESRYWTTITGDRYEVIDAATGDVLAEGDELWIDAGGTRYRCGLASGPLPVKRREEPDPSAIDAFVRRANGGPT